jgi:tonB-dependent receptor
MRACLDTLGRPNSVGYFAADPDLRYEPILDMGVFLRVNNIFNKDDPNSILR